MGQTDGKKLGGFDKVLIGCGIGCAAVILLSLVSFAFGAMWLFSPGKQSPTDVIANESSLGAMRLHALAEDPGTQELITRVLEGIQESSRDQQREQLPSSMRWISDLQSQQADPSGFNMLFPKEMTFAFEAAEDGDGVDYVAAFNPRIMVRMFKTMFGFIGLSDDGKVRSTYQGHPIYQLEEDLYLVFAESTVLVSSAERVIERAIDRIEAGPIATIGATDGFDFESIPPGDWDIEGSLSSEGGLAESFLEMVLPEPELIEVVSPETVTTPADPPTEDAIAGFPNSEDLRIGFGFDVVSADEVTGLTVLECRDEDTAARWRVALEKRYEAMRTEAEERGLNYEIEARIEGTRVVTELRLRGVEDLLVSALTFAGS